MKNERMGIMKVSELMTGGVETIDATATLNEAASLMKTYDVGFLPVLEDGKVAGVISDRDIVVRAIAGDSDPRKTTVSGAMTRNVIHCSTEDSLDEAAARMEEKEVRRVLVIDPENRVVGVLSVGDIAARAGKSETAGEVMQEVNKDIPQKHGAVSSTAG